MEAARWREPGRDALLVESEDGENGAFHGITGSLGIGNGVVRQRVRVENGGRLTCALLHRDLGALLSVALPGALP